MVFYWPIQVELKFFDGVKEGCKAAKAVLRLFGKLLECAGKQNWFLKAWRGSFRIGRRAVSRLWRFS